MAEDVQGFGPLYLETNRAKRLEMFHRLITWFNINKQDPKVMNSKEGGDWFADGRFPYLNLEPWFEDPDPPWERRPFTVPINEIFSNVELHYPSLLLMLEKRCASISQTVDGTKPAAPMSDELVEKSKAWEKSHPGLGEALEKEHVPGLESVERDGGGMRFLCFRTTTVPMGILERFLESSKHDDSRTEASRNLAPFSYLFVDTNPLPLETYEGGATRKEDLGTHAPPTRFGGRSTEDIVRAFEDVVAPIKDRRSLYATRCFVVLDEKTAEDGNTIEVVAIRYEGWCRRRATFGALRKGVLKAFEMLMLDPDLLATDEDVVIREDMYGADDK